MRESADPDDDIKVLEGIVGELALLTEDEKGRFVDFVEAEAAHADESQLSHDYCDFLLSFPGEHGPH